MLAIKVLVRKIRGAELQHTWQLLMGRYIDSLEQLSVLGLVVNVAFLNITQVNALGALLEVSNREVREACTG